MATLIEKYEILTSNVVDRIEVPTWASKVGYVLNPYNIHYMNLITNIAKFMCSDNLYGAIIQSSFGYSEDCTGKIILGDVVEYSMVSDIFERNINGGNLNFLSNYLEFDGYDLNNQKECSIIKEKVLKIKDYKEIKKDIVLSLETSLLKSDYQDPQSYYNNEDFFLFRIEGNWYIGTQNQENLTINLFSFIPLTKWVSFYEKLPTLEKEGLTSVDIYGSVELYSEDIMALLDYTMYTPTKIKKVDFMKETDIYTIYNPIIVSMGFDWNLSDMEPMSNTLLDKDMEIFNLLSKKSKALVKFSR